MAALSGKTPKTVLSGSEILPIQDGGELKRTDINAIVRKVADEQGARTVNLGTNPVAAQRTFEADGNLSAGDGVTIYRDGSTVKAKKLGTGVVTQEQSGDLPRDTNFSDLDIDLYDIYWTPTETDRDSQLGILGEGETLPAGAEKVFDASSSITIRITELIADDTLVVVGYVSKFKRFIDFDYQAGSGANVGNLAVPTGETIKTSSSLFTGSQNDHHSTFIVVLKKESGSWVCKEAVAIPLTRALKTLNNSLVLQGAETGLRCESYALGKLGTDTYVIDIYRSSYSSYPFSSSSYSNNTSALLYSNSNRRNRYHALPFKIVDGKVQLLCFDKGGFYSNFEWVTNDEYTSFDEARRIFYGTSYASNRHFIKLDNDDQGERILAFNGGRYNSTGNMTPFILRPTITGRVISFAYTHFLNSTRYVSSVSYFSFLSSDRGSYLIPRLFKTTQGDFIAFQYSGNLYCYELKENQTYFLENFNTTLRRYPTKSESENSTNAIELKTVLSTIEPNPISSYLDFVESSDEHEEFNYFNGSRQSESYFPVSYYKDDFSRINSRQGVVVNLRDSNNNSEFVNLICHYLNGLRSGAVIKYAVFGSGSNRTAKISYEYVPSGDTVISTGDNETLLGFALNDITSGATGTIQLLIAGSVLSGFTSLQSGARYFYDATSGLNRDGIGKLVGVAMSTTEIFVQQN